MEDRFAEDVLITDISVISGIRPSGLAVDKSSRGRKSCGFLYVWDGEATFYVDGASQIVLHSKELLFLPKNKKYKMKYTAPATTFVLVNFDMVNAEGEEISFWDDITFLARDDDYNGIARIMADFEVSSASKTAKDSFRKKELLYRLLGLISDSTQFHLSARASCSKISEGVRLLQQTYLENLPISRFSDACHININTFRNLFNKQFGMSPVKYRNQLRVQRARELLREGLFTVSEVSYASGFDNVGYFCRYYRKITGESPSDTKNGTTKQNTNSST